ncbi:14591_t:CDS:2 [Dentiscutata heterogama]|uniref:14591_t:CDS:1 n=1 Tax=Dentiscutata heterogama TaxID=1316150 RepID=A0ACA9JYT7_9GLOM|nr:14591_t:CDS:2 [Dentiscutata heterogama]
MSELSIHPTPPNTESAMRSHKEIAQKYLPIPAISVSSERLFSNTRKLISSKRTSLDLALVDNFKDKHFIKNSWELHNMMNKDYNLNNSYPQSEIYYRSICLKLTDKDIHILSEFRDTTMIVYSQETDSILFRQHTSKTDPSEDNNTSIFSDQPNLEIGNTLFEILAFSLLNIFCQDAILFEITTFVVNSPEIFSVANMIYQSKQISRSQSSISKELLIKKLLKLLLSQDNEKQSISESTLDLEELKCLFLHTQNSSQAAFDQLVAMILPNSKLADDDFQQLLKKSKGMFRYKKVLQKYLLNAQESKFIEVIQNALKRFIQTVFKVHVIHTYKEIQQEFSLYKKVLEDIKNMNSTTQSLDILTREKSNILRLFLYNSDSNYLNFQR